MHRGGIHVEVDLEKEPDEGEVLIFTNGGGFSVRGAVKDIVARLSAEEWPAFELAQSGDAVVIRSSQVVALRGGSRQKRSAIGFVGHT
jgi:hypothetical protein